MIVVKKKRIGKYGGDRMKKIIVYFSWSGNTLDLALKIKDALKYDMVRIEREVPYSKDYHECAYVEAKEEFEKRILPKIKSLNIEFSDYEEIILMFPIWWYTIPMCVGTFIKELKSYKGKVIICANSYTNDKQYMINSLNDIRKIHPELDVVEGLFNKSVLEHIKFLKEE